MFIAYIITESYFWKPWLNGTKHWFHVIPINASLLYLYGCSFEPFYVYVFLVKDFVFNILAYCETESYHSRIFISVWFDHENSIYWFVLTNFNQCWIKKIHLLTFVSKCCSLCFVSWNNYSKNEVFFSIIWCVQCLYVDVLT